MHVQTPWPRATRIVHPWRRLAWIPLLGCVAALVSGALASRDAELAHRLEAISDATAVKRIETFYSDEDLRAPELSREQREAGQAIESMWLARSVAERHQARATRAWIGAGVLGLLAIWALRVRRVEAEDA
ncbi:MAG: hypothetical protein ACPG4T_15270 [Nannocystaceae bacterium]